MFLQVVISENIGESAVLYRSLIGYEMEEALVVAGVLRTLLHRQQRI